MEGDRYIGILFSDLSRRTNIRGSVEISSCWGNVRVLRAIGTLLALWWRLHRLSLSLKAQRLEAESVEGS